MTNAYDIAQDIIQDDAQDLAQYSDKEKQLLGTEIVAGKVNYGFIVRFKYTYTNYETIMSVITDLDFEFDADDLLSFIRLLANRGTSKEKVYPDGTDYSKRVTGAKRKSRTSAITGSSYIHPSQFMK